MEEHLSEEDVSVKFITPAIVQAGWDEATQIRRQVSFTKGRIIVRGRLVARGKAKKADFVGLDGWRPCRIKPQRRSCHLAHLAPPRRRRWTAHPDD